MFSDELSRRKLLHIKYRHKIALPIGGKCDNPRRLLELICKGMMIIKNDRQRGLRIEELHPLVALYDDNYYYFIGTSDNGYGWYLDDSRNGRIVHNENI